MKTKALAFTLIELLIVVAIIAILAAIAVPNFLEAQVRSKVSRSKADLRTQATALEAYAVDNNKYPAAYEQHNQVAWDAPNAVSTPPFHSRMPSLLTTPIAYITSIPKDAFRGDNVTAPLGASLEAVEDRHVYFNFPFFRETIPSAFPNGTFGRATALAGDWLMYSPGPDADEFNRLSYQDSTNARRVYIDYDPTNGTVSQGNIFRTQASGEVLGVDEWFLQ